MNKKPSYKFTEEEFLELFKYTGPEVIPGEFYRAVNKVMQNVYKRGYDFGEDIGWNNGVDKVIEIMKD